MSVNFYFKRNLSYIASMLFTRINFSYGHVDTQKKYATVEIHPYRERSLARERSYPDESILQLEVGTLVRG